jgi:hypothetical protein
MVVHHVRNCWGYVLGSWFQDKRHGKGQYTYPNGDIYKGQWKDNKRDGVGTYHFQNPISQVMLYNYFLLISIEELMFDHSN